MKIFCSQCRHFWQRDMYADQCKHPKNIEEEVVLDSHIRRGGNTHKLYPMFPPHELNSDNNCKWFQYKQPPWWLTFLKQRVKLPTVILTIFLELMLIAAILIPFL